jgi:hypothetical protein
MQDRIDPRELDRPLFTVGELAQAADIERGLADVWVHRGIIVPTRLAKAGGRKRPHFSLRAIFRAKLVRMLTEHLAIGPSDSAQLAAESGAIAVADMLDNNDWMMVVLNNRNLPFKIWAAVSRTRKKWRWKLFTKADEIIDPFGDSVPFVVLQLWAALLDVYRKCEPLHDFAMRGTKTDGA